MKEDLKAKVAVITGASMGLGRYLCQYFSGLGLKVAAAARSADKLKSLEKEIVKDGGIISCYQLDIADYDAIAGMVDKIVGQWGTIDILINNAGTACYKPLEDMDRGDIDRVIQTNLMGTIYFTRLVAPVMIKAGKGHIFNISSTSGLRGDKDNGTYSASKFGINGFGHSMARYLMEHNIHVTNLCPGAINTTWWDRDEYIWGDRDKITKPAEIAELIEFILRSEHNTIYRQMVFFPVNEIEEL